MILTIRPNTLFDAGRFIASFLVMGLHTHGNANELIAEFGRKHALNIYLYHVLIRELITLSRVGAVLNNTLLIFFISFLLSVLIEDCKEAIWKMYRDMFNRDTFFWVLVKRRNRLIND